MNRWKKWGVLLGLLLLVIGIFAGIQVKKSGESISQFRLIIDDYFKSEQFFVDETVLRNRLQEAGLREIKGKRVDEINLIELENALEQVEYVADAKAYFTMQKELVVEVSQRVPVLRVFNRYGQSYYVDQKGSLMATTPHFSAYCLVATGDIGTNYRKNITDSGLVFDLAKMAYELGKQESTSGLFTQISVEGDAVWLISRIEGFPCRVAINSPIIPQVYKWLAFVSGADSTGGWRNKYEAVDLRFSNQVVAIQRGRKIHYGELAIPTIDSAAKPIESPIIIDTKPQISPSKSNSTEKRNNLEKKSGTEKKKSKKVPEKEKKSEKKKVEKSKKKTTKKEPKKSKNKNQNR